MIGDGLIIAIKFTEELVDDVNCPDAFTVSFNQWKYIPNGYLEEVTREVESVEIDENDAKIIYLNFSAGTKNSIQNAVGDITIEYDSSIGTLRGYGAPVQSFTESFTPTDLEPKNDTHEQEHLSVNISFDDDLIQIYYHDTKEDEHINLGLTFLGTLTYVGDL